MRSTIIYLSQSTLIDMSVGQRLQQLREERQLTLEQAGKIGGTTKQSMSQIEKGTTKVPGGLPLYLWSKHYGVNLEWLITGKGDRSGSSQPARPTTDNIIAAARLAATSLIDNHPLDPSLPEDAELLALALAEVLDDDIVEVTDTHAQRFAQRLMASGGSSGKERSDREDGGTGSAPRKAPARAETRPAPSRARKRA